MKKVIMDCQWCNGTGKMGNGVCIYCGGSKTFTFTEDDGQKKETVEDLRRKSR